MRCDKLQDLVDILNCRRVCKIPRMI